MTAFRLLHGVITLHEVAFRLFHNPTTGLRRDLAKHYHFSCISVSSSSSESRLVKSVQGRQVKQLSLVVEKKQQNVDFFQSKGRGGRENMVVFTHKGTHYKSVPHIAQPYVLLLAAAQTQAAEPVPV